MNPDIDFTEDDILSDEDNVSLLLLQMMEESRVELSPEEVKEALDKIMEDAKLQDILRLLEQNPSPLSLEEWRKEAYKLIEKGRPLYSWMLLKGNASKLSPRQIDALFPIFTREFSKLNRWTGKLNISELRAIIERVDVRELAKFWQEKHSELTEEENAVMLVKVAPYRSRLLVELTGLRIGSCN
jgi:hypothetical protein